MPGLLDFNNPAMLNLAASLLESSGPSRTPVSTGQALGRGLLSYQQGQMFGSKQKEDALRQKILEMQFQEKQTGMDEKQAQQEFFSSAAMKYAPTGQQQALSQYGGPSIAAAEAAPSMQDQPMDVEGLYRGMLGVPGMAERALEGFDKLTGKSGDTPMSIKEWDIFSKLPAEDQSRYLTMKRAEKTIDLGNQVVMPTPGAPGQVSAAFQKGLPPQDLPSVRGAQSSAVEGAKTSWAAELERQKLAGTGVISPKEKKGTAQTQVSGILGELKGLYNDLDKYGGIVSTKRGATANIPARLSSSVVGQSLGGAVGTESQSLRNKINQSRPLLINYIRQASEMGARGLDSEKELEFYLKAATDPTLDVQSNLNALRVLEQAYGEGARQKSENSGSWGIRRLP